ncbi:EAL domain-containing protein [Effusibacillus lacus]|uniref:EAL domain-containing protein n=1 Tax=Effusibacillus lacus TaxID=1348429 RepID=A0A292YE78_9BACL|nr:EAL domain-containing protein [Effusibacillus lacus]TCS76850.1 EAL domain-containing protein (putative c-di-GMP-specific phosphodiesterase class I) [Effusibacillus lacus]GAX91182.1 EAL domain-containing protein [Effusibacillus lacus]
MNKNSLKNIELYPLYQRIVRLTDPATDFAYEATIRGRRANGKDLPPSVLFQQPEQKQMLLDYIARHIAVREAVSFVKNSLLFLNGHALSLQAGFIFEDVTKLEVPINQLVLEITEQTRIHSVESLKRELDTLRAQGMKLALDDFGTGFSNFWLVEALQPDYIKLDRSVIARVDQSDQARRVIEGMVAFADKVKTTLIAEGIEREAQRDILIELGVPYGQGFFLGLPFALSKTMAHMPKKLRGKP